jgi:hypothetical protein
MMCIAEAIPMSMEICCELLGLRVTKRILLAPPLDGALSPCSEKIGSKRSRLLRPTHEREMPYPLYMYVVANTPRWFRLADFGALRKVRGPQWLCQGRPCERMIRPNTNRS